MLCALKQTEVPGILNGWVTQILSHVYLQARRDKSFFFFFYAGHDVQIDFTTIKRYHLSILYLTNTLIVLDSTLDNSG